MPLNKKVSLQISLSQGDYLLARHLLPKQLNLLANQVDEVILTIDTKPGKGRFAAGWQLYKKELDTFLENEIQPNFNLRIIPVDYSKPIKKLISTHFFGQDNMPDKDFRGGPFYAYFFGLYKAANDIIFHLDADIFLGGDSQIWVNEALQRFQNDPACLIISPLPGPPHPLDILIGQSVIEKIAPYTYQLDGMSTRLFMIDRFKFKTQKLVLSKPGIRNQFKAIIEGNPNADLPEHIILAYIKTNGFKRVDFLGSGTGLWSLHPPYRTTSFYNDLPKLITRIEQNDLPEEQLGFYDIIDEVCDWAEAREKLSQQRWWKRLLKNE